MNATHALPASPAAALPTRTVMAVLVAAAMASLTLAAQAQAQTPPAPSDEQSKVPASPLRESSAAKLDTVTVTATRRREPARDVPIQVNTLAAEPLEKSGANSLSDYVGSLPGIDVKTANGPGLGSVSIRGVTTGGDAIATVGMYVDDVAFGSSSAYASGSTSALDMSLLDLHHIEVLRGPQGTLYGAGAMGGLLKYVTNEPDLYELSGKVMLGVRSLGQGGIGHVAGAVVNLPLSEGVAGVRVAAFHDHDPGYLTAVGGMPGNNINRGDTTGGRVSVLLSPSAKLNIRLSAIAQNIDRKGNGIVDYDIATGRPTDGDLTRRLSLGEPYAIDIRLLSADVEYDFGWARLNSITSHQEVKRNDRMDAAFYDPALSAGVGAPVHLSRLDGSASVRKNTQEFRLTSAPGTIEWLGGLYYNEETGRFSQVLATQLVSDGTPITMPLDVPSTYKETALYGDLTYNLAKDWSFTAGARFARNKQTFTQLASGAVAGSGSSSENFNTYLATVRYSLSKVSNLYFRGASGYRAGGPNAVALDAAGQPIPGTPSAFKSDSLWSYELGYKGDLLDKRLSIEASVYDIEWKDIQQPLAIGSTTITVNAGAARVRGAELFTRYRMTDDWRVNASLAYTDARLVEDAPALGAAGSRLPNSAKVSASLGLEGGFSLAGRPATAGANLRYVGERNSGFDTAGTSVPNFKMPSYVLADVQGGVTLGAFELGVYVRNVFDTRALLAADAALVAFGSPLHASVVQPRTLGLTVTTKF